MAQQKDQVFQLSLTEIAFIITFLLLLLLGYVIFKEETDRKAAQAELATIQSTQQATGALSSAKRELTKALEDAGAKNPSEIITKLVAVESVRNERDRLKQKVDDLNTKLTALVELEERLQKVGNSQRSDMIKNEIVSALALRDQIAKALATAQNNEHVEIKFDKNAAKKNSSAGLGIQAASMSDARPLRANRDLLPLVKNAIMISEVLKAQLRTNMSKELTPGREDQEIQDVVSAARDFAKLSSNGSSPGILAKENSDLRGQVAFLKHRLDARGGRDFPPCWADETGKVEFLFALETKSGSVTISPAWPERREASARALPGINEALGGPHAHQDFPSQVRALFNWSKAQSPECRHYVQLKSSIADAIQSDRARLMIENFFYKVEVRR
ncbi:hypothetical protein [Massilia glaciei]|uniref:hypothetical protein n=1 Tax=Massilia glaciei TaxID=1524097 RepID=UPI0011B2889F|nr:hypothetical protein [Massilia glaciei]